MINHDPNDPNRDASKSWDLSTREDFLREVKDLSADDAWNRFYSLYSPLIHDVARKRGLNEADAKEIIQEVFLDLTRKLPAFEYDPSKQSFRGWLATLARWRILDLIRARKTVSLERINGEPAAMSDHEALWEEEWKTLLLEEAMRRVEQQIDPAVLQIYLIAKRSGPPEAAKVLKKTLPAIYDATHKVKICLQQEVEHLRKARW